MEKKITFFTVLKLFIRYVFVLFFKNKINSNFSSLKLGKPSEFNSFIVLTLDTVCNCNVFKGKIKKPPFSLPAASEEDILKGKQSIRSQALGNQNSESETLLDGDDDTLSSLEDKDLENLAGNGKRPVVITSQSFSTLQPGQNKGTRSL